MKLDKKLGRLRREAIASPKKAAVLGILLLVAVWYWAPLVAGWIKPDATAAAEPAAPAAVPGQTPAAAQPAVGEKAPAPKHPWSEIARWIENDPRMHTARELPGRPDPFDPVEPPSAVAVDGAAGQEQAAAAPAETKLDPESLGIVVSSTIVGSQGGAALIDGRSYRLGATIRVDHDGKPIDFELTAIRPDAVVLRRAGRDYEVRLPEMTTSGQIEISIMDE